MPFLRVDHVINVAGSKAVQCHGQRSFLFLHLLYQYMQRAKNDAQKTLSLFVDTFLKIFS